MRVLFICAITAVVCCLGGNAAWSHPEQGRIMPPTQLKCDRSDLTSYDGRVVAYRRRKGSTFLRMRTNFDTTEEVTIRHRGTDDPSKFYLLNSREFTRADWKLIELRPRVLKPGMRANVWVCRGNPSIQPMVDWRPDDTGANPEAAKASTGSRSVHLIETVLTFTNSRIPNSPSSRP